MQRGGAYKKSEFEVIETSDINSRIGELLNQYRVVNDARSRKQVRCSVKKLTVRLKALYGRKYEKLQPGSEAAIAEYVEWARIFVPYMRTDANKKDLAKAMDMLLGSTITEWPPCPADFRRVLNDISLRPRSFNNAEYKKLEAKSSDPETAKKCWRQIQEKLAAYPLISDREKS